MSIALGGSNIIESTPTDRQVLGQQSNVYAAEAALRAGPQFESIEAVQVFVDSLTAADWWFAHEVVRVEVFNLPENKTVCGLGENVHEHNAGAIHLTKSGLDVLTVLHEVAHTITHKGGGHGPVFCRQYLSLVYHVLGSDAYKELYDSMLQHGVLLD